MRHSLSMLQLPYLSVRLSGYGFGHLASYRVKLQSEVVHQNIVKNEFSECQFGCHSHNMIAR